ncbi:MAG TPA: BamA/TamA family outer membrane protein [Syntrophobacteraceae bacterium]|nr:BamA/TamA family outer membrane protein [Syntrophobacteraceae bacterium]
MFLLILLPHLWAGCSGAAEGEQSQAPENKQKPQLQVREIRFEGNKFVSSSELKKILSTKERKFRWFFKSPLDQKVFSEDLERIPQYYLSQGFYHMRLISHEIEPLVGNNVRIIIRLEEGPPMMVSELDLKIDGPSPERWREEIVRILPVRAGKRFTNPGYRDIEKIVRAWLARRGYPKAKVDMHARLDKGSDLGTVSVEIEVGPVCTFGPLSVEGNESVSSHIILRELTFHQGERFDGSKIEASRQRLFALDLFQFVDISVQDLEKTTTALPIRVLVKETKKQTIRLGVGYGTDDQVRGQAQYEIRDFLGDGRRLEINLKASFIVQMIEGRFVQPYFMGTKGNFILVGGIMRESEVSFDNLKQYVRPKYEYKWFEGLASYFGYNFEANYLENVVIPPSATDQEHQAYYVSSLIAGSTWDRVDSLLDPKKGWRVLQDMEWASSLLGSQVDYFKFTLEGRGYLPVFGFATLASRLRYGGIEPLEGTTEVPIFKRFFSGGTDSVRGYPYQRLGPLAPDGNPIGGMELLEGSLEWRFPIKPPLEGVVFSDFGNIAPTIRTFSWADTRYTAGVGVRYLTIVGPLRFDVGYEINPPQYASFSPYQFHFSIGQAF